MSSETGVFFTDFDGTVTRRDFYRLVLDEMPLELAHDPWTAYRRGGLTHFEALRDIFGGLRTDLHSLDALLDRMEPDPLLAADLGRLREAGWVVHIVSAGSEYYIRRILARAGVDHDVAVHSNPGRFTPEGGIELSRAADPRIRSEAVGIDKAATVRLYGEGAERVVFAGDSLPDLEAARLVAAGDRFAKDSLAHRLDELGLGYRPFERWHDVVEALL